MTYSDLISHYRRMVRCGARMTPEDLRKLTDRIEALTRALIAISQVSKDAQTKISAKTALGFEYQTKGNK
jgi:hypothetical protein